MGTNTWKSTTSPSRLFRRTIKQQSFGSCQEIKNSIREPSKLNKVYNHHQNKWILPTTFFKWIFIFIFFCMKLDFAHMQKINIFLILHQKWLKVDSLKFRIKKILKKKLFLDMKNIFDLPTNLQFFLQIHPFFHIFLEKKWCNVSFFFFALSYNCSVFFCCIFLSLTSFNLKCFLIFRNLTLSLCLSLQNAGLDCVGSRHVGPRRPHTSCRWSNHLLRHEVPQSATVVKQVIFQKIWDFP